MKSNVADRMFSNFRACLLVIVVAVVSGCHLTGNWKLESFQKGHESTPHGAPEHTTKEEKFTIEVCPSDSSAFCFTNLSDGFKPKDAWTLVRLHHPSKSLVIKLQKVLVATKSGNEIQLCSSHCLVGDLDGHTDKTHVVVVEKAADSDCKEGSPCVKLVVICGSRVCVETVSAMETRKGQLKVWHLGSGHAHSND